MIDCKMTDGKTEQSPVDTDINRVQQKQVKGSRDFKCVKPIEGK